MDKTARMLSKKFCKLLDWRVPAMLIGSNSYQFAQLFHWLMHDRFYNQDHKNVDQDNHFESRNNHINSIFGRNKFLSHCQHDDECMDLPLGAELNLKGRERVAPFFCSYIAWPLADPTGHVLTSNPSPFGWVGCG